MTEYSSSDPQRSSYTIPYPQISDLDHQHVAETGYETVQFTMSTKAKRKRLSEENCDETNQNHKRSKVEEKEQNGGQENAVPPKPKRKGKGKEKEKATEPLEAIQVVVPGGQEITNDTPPAPPKSKAPSRRVRVKKKTGPGVFEKYNLRDPSSCSSISGASNAEVAQPLASTSSSTGYIHPTSSTESQAVHTSRLLTDAQLETFINQFAQKASQGHSPLEILCSAQVAEYAPHGGGDIVDGTQPLLIIENHGETALAADDPPSNESNLHELLGSCSDVDQSYFSHAEFFSLPLESNSENLFLPPQYEESQVEEPQVWWEYNNCQAPPEPTAPNYFYNFY